MKLKGKYLSNISHGNEIQTYVSYLKEQHKQVKW